MTTAEVRLVPANAVSDLRRLESLARAVFGDGQRPPGWFERKLHRECVSASHSWLLTTAAQADDARGWVGYGLLGTPPSLAPIARTAGIGLLAPWRGRGEGRRLVDALRDAAAAAGSTGLRIPASPHSAPFYTRCGLQALDPTLTLLAFGTGHHDASPALAWDAPLPGPVQSAWLREGWERAPHPFTVEVRDGHDRFDVSMEGSAHVAMRWASSDGSPDAPQAWLERVPRGAPALLHEVPAGAPFVQTLLERGWTVVQRTITMQATWASTPG